VAVTPLELVLANSGAERCPEFALGFFELLELAVIPNTTPPTITSSRTQLTAWVRIGRRRKRRHDLLTKVPEPDAATRRLLVRSPHDTTGRLRQEGAIR
jgi:hypothetical protein